MADLYESASVTLNGSGVGQVRLGPIGHREKWYPETASVKTNQTTVTNEAVCAIYVGNDTTQQYFRDQTFSGSSGDVSGKVSGPLTLTTKRYIFAVWTGGDAGAVATLIVAGTKDV